MSRHLRVEPYESPVSGMPLPCWCVREYVRSDDNLYFHRNVLPGSIHPTRDETADWLEAQRTEGAVG